MPNNTLQMTFDPLLTFSAAQSVIASIAPKDERSLNSKSNHPN